MTTDVQNCKLFISNALEKLAHIFKVILHIQNGIANCPLNITLKIKQIIVNKYSHKVCKGTLKIAPFTLHTHGGCI